MSLHFSRVTALAALVCMMSCSRDKDIQGTPVPDSTPLQRLDALLVPGAVRFSEWMDVPIDRLELRTWRVGDGNEIGTVGLRGGGLDPKVESALSVFVAANGAVNVLGTTARPSTSPASFVPLVGGSTAAVTCAGIAVINPLGETSSGLGLPCRFDPATVAGTALNAGEVVIATGIVSTLNVHTRTVMNTASSASAQAVYNELGDIAARYVREVTPGVFEWVVCDTAGAHVTYGRSDTTATKTTTAFTFPPVASVRLPAESSFRAEPSGALLVDRGSEVFRWHVESDGSVEVVATPESPPGGFSPWSAPYGFGAAHADLTQPNTDDPDRMLTVPIESRARCFGSDGKFRSVSAPPTPCRVTEDCRKIGESYLLGVTNVETAPLGIYAVWGWHTDATITTDSNTGKRIYKANVALVAARLDRSGAPPPAPRICVGGSARCADASKRQVCADDGSAWRDETCAGATPVCAGATCAACTDAATQCAPPKDGCLAATCTSTGCGTMPKTLGATCVNAAGAMSVCSAKGCGTCMPGDTFCNGANGGRCGADGQFVEGPCDTYCAAGGKCASVTKLFAGGENTCAIMSDKGVYCWGRIPNFAAKPLRLDLSTNTTELAIGGGHACARAMGNVTCWGANTAGQLGNGKAEQVFVAPHLLLPVAVYGATRISAGNDHTCAVAPAGVLCWGWNPNGEVTPFDSAQLQPSARLALSQGTEVFAGGSHTCARGASEWSCWGKNDAGQLGAPPGPKLVSLAFSPSQLALGAQHTCALEADGVRCWGANAAGQLGTGDTMDRTSPPPPITALSATTIVAGGRTTFAVRADGTVMGWGANDVGQLGTGAISGDPTATPMELTGVGKVLQLVAGSEHACALFADGAVRCWGANASGQLGDGTKTARIIPTKVVF